MSVRIEYIIIGALALWAIWYFNRDTDSAKQPSPAPVQTPKKELTPVFIVGDLDEGEYV